MTYNEYWQVIDGGLTPDDLVTFKYEDQGVATLEDGLYVLEENLCRSGFRGPDGTVCACLDARMENGPK